MNPLVEKLSKDLRDASKILSLDEARFLVDAYYIMQDGRMRSASQVRSMKEEPCDVLEWYKEQSQTLESQIKRALEAFTDAHPVGEWLKGIVGIGPVISAGFIAHIDIRQAPTAGHIWRYAGLDPTVTWEKGQKRPWNPKLKTLCWKAGQSFMKFSGRDDCQYGKLYRERKEYEAKRNDLGENAKLAETLLTKFKKKTEARKYLLNGKLPPAHIDARARRWAVKIFLSHLQAYWWELDTGTPVPAPFAIAILGHAHKIDHNGAGQERN